MVRRIQGQGIRREKAQAVSTVFFTRLLVIYELFSNSVIYYIRAETKQLILRKAVKLREQRLRQKAAKEKVEANRHEKERLHQ